MTEYSEECNIDKLKWNKTTTKVVMKLTPPYLERRGSDRNDFKPGLASSNVTANLSGLVLGSVEADFCN